MATSQMMRLPPMPTLQELIRLYKLGAKKKMSQNFLLDLNLTRKIVKKVGKRLDGYHILEVGPGPGGITRSILEAGVDRLSVVELDRRFLPSLELLNQASGGRMKVYNSDIMTFPTESVFPENLAQSWQSSPPKLRIIGNLPFNVSTPLIIRWLKSISEQSGAWSRGRVGLTLTFQQEVGERMVAMKRGDQRSRLSIMTQTFCKVRHDFTIPGKAFVPQPKVDVAVISFEPRVVPLIPYPFPMVEKVVRHVFHYRQKMCKRGIGTLFPPDRADLVQFIFKHSLVNPESRPTELSIEDFHGLCSAYSILCEKHEGLFLYDYRSKENAPAWRNAVHL